MNAKVELDSFSISVSSSDISEPMVNKCKELQKLNTKPLCLYAIHFVKTAIINLFIL